MKNFNSVLIIFVLQERAWVQIRAFQQHDTFDAETTSISQLTAVKPDRDALICEVQHLALKAHLKARQSTDLLHDLAQRVTPSEGPFQSGERVVFWFQDSSKFKDVGRWIPGTVVIHHGPMVTIETKTNVVKVNQTKVRKVNDPWHDAPLPPPR